MRTRLDSRKLQFILNSIPLRSRSIEIKLDLSVGKLVLLNTLYYLHELFISLIEFRFTPMSFQQLLLFFINVIEFQFNRIIHKVLLMNFSLT